MLTFAVISHRSARRLRALFERVHVSDYQQVHKGDLLVELQDNDYQAQVEQAKAAVAAAKAAHRE